jgi:hypothetical protein
VPHDLTSETKTVDTSQQLPLEGSGQFNSPGSPGVSPEETTGVPDGSHKPVRPDAEPQTPVPLLQHASHESAVGGTSSEASRERPGAAHTHQVDLETGQPNVHRPSSGSAGTVRPQGSLIGEQMPGRPNAGDELEIRLARMYFWQGSYARRGISMERHFHPDPLLVTDLDLLAYQISPQLELIKTIGEAKSGTGRTAPKPLDRAIWLAGLMKLVHADRASLVTALTPSTRVRETVRALGVHAIGIDEITRWENVWLPSSLADCGSHGPTAFRDAELTRNRCKAEPELERAYWFLRSEVWFLDPWQAAKRIIGALDRFHSWWTPGVEDGTEAALRWLYAEALSILTLNLVALTGQSWAIASSEWPTVVQDRLSEGAVPTHVMRSLADSFDKYLSRALKEAGGDNRILIESMGAFHPSPPKWAQPFVELIERLSKSSCLIDLPRHTDFIIYERLVKRQHANVEALERVSRASQDALARDRRQVAAFLRACVKLPDAVSKALTI